MKSFYYNTTEQERKYLEKNKPITKDALYKFGLKEDSATFKGTLEELRRSVPNIVVGVSVRDIKFTQNLFKQQHLVKGGRYVMSLGVFQQLWKHDHIVNMKPSNIKFKNIYKPYFGQDLTDKTLLVTRTGGIGDLLFIQPNLIFLKQKYPTCRILFACGPQYQSMVNNWDCVDEVIDLPFPLETMILESDYQAVFEGVIERCSEAHTKNAYNLFTEWLGTNLPDELLIPKQEAKSEKVEYCKQILNQWGLKEKEFLLFQLRTSSPIRTPSPETWKQVIDHLIKNGYNIVITDGKHNSDIVEEFINTLDNPEKCFNFAKYSDSLDCSIGLTSLAKVCISADSALVHIAASLGVKSLGIYGPFPGKIRLTTYGKLADWIDCNVGCSPCFIHGHRPCKNSDNGGHGKCFRSLNVDEVLEKVKKLEND